MDQLHKNLGWNRWGVHPSKLMDVMEDREVWRLNLELLPPNPNGIEGNKEIRRIGLLMLDRYQSMTRLVLPKLY